MAGSGDRERRRLRATFTEDAELYERARPGYPDALFDDLIRLSGVPPAGRVLEVGCGTGQATLPMLRRGLRVTAVELGAAMAAVARRNLAAHGEVAVHHAAFETWPLPAEPFDLVVGATSFHWIDPAVRWQKAAAALKLGGAIAVFGGSHVAGGDTDFFEAAQACYERFMPGTPPGLRLTPPDEVPDDNAEIDASGLFEPSAHRRYVWEISCTTAAYIDLLNTFSNHRALDPDNRRRLLDCVADLLDRGFGGRVRKAYLTQLTVARRR